MRLKNVLAAVLFFGAAVIVNCDEYSNSTAKLKYSADNPCNCYFQDSCGCVCSRPITWTQFQMLPQNFRPCKGFTLALRGGTFHSFPSDYFFRVGNVKDFVLDVGRVAFQYMNDAQGESSPYNGVTFDASAFIRTFEVSVSKRWNWGALYWLAPTTSSAYCEIQIIRSTLPLLEADFSRICQGVVTVVNVVSSGVSAIENKAFATFYKLKEFDISNNRLQEIRRSYFSYPANQLQFINLANNNIRVLPNDIFSQMPSLQSVNLRGNPVSTLDERIFRPIFRKVEIVGLESLPLTCDCKARWMKEPAQLCGTNIYGLADMICKGPASLKGYSYFNETLPKDLVC